MSRENVELVRRGLEAFNDRDLDALMELYTEDVEWRLIGGFVDLMGSELSGRDAVRGFFSDWIENLGGRAESETVLEAGDRVVQVLRLTSTGGASGAPATQRMGQVFSFRDGRACAVDNYWDADEALEAAGLSA